MFANYHVDSFIFFQGISDTNLISFLFQLESDSLLFRFFKGDLLEFIREKSVQVEQKAYHKNHWGE